MNNTMKNKREKNVEKNASGTIRGWLYGCTGLILLFIAMIGGTGKTVIGTFMVYYLGYLFGMFYPLILVAIGVIGLRLLITHKFFPYKEQNIIYAGILLVILGTLAFGSFPIYALPTGKVAFASLNSFYGDRMVAFATSPWVIDSYESLSVLGGGYVGLLMLTVLGSIWGIIGDAIFFSAVMLVGVALLLFRPIRSAVRTIQEDRKNKVKYSSPYQPGKGKDNSYLARQINGEDVPLEKEETRDLSSFTPTSNATAPFSKKWAEMEQGSFTSADGSAYNPNMADSVGETPSKVEEHFHVAKQAKAKEEPSPIDESLFRSAPAMAATPSRTTRTEPQPRYANPQPSSYPQSKPQMMDDNPFQSAYSPVRDSYANDDLSTRAQEFSRNALSKDQSIPVQEQVRDYPSNYADPYGRRAPVENSFNPASRPAQSYSAPAYTPAKPAEFAVKSNKSVMTPAPTFEVKSEQAPAIEEKTMSDEEIEQQKEREYFARKQKKQADALLAKKRAKEEKVASLMKYVSDVPKDYYYQLPNDSLLEEIDDSAKMEKNTESAQEKANIINKVFDEFAVKAKATTFTIGASVTRFNVETEHGEKADKIANLTSEFQRALNGDMSVRVETVVQGRSTSGIEVGNIAPMAVSFKDMFQFIQQDKEHPLLLPIGKDIGGEIITFPLDKMPHMLVAGTTGSGKSVLIHSMIMTLIMRTYPSQVKLMLIDPKQVEFIRYADESHLFCPVISKPESAILALKKLCDEMDRRFAVLSKCRCANLGDYNDLRRGHELQYENMPYVVTVIDEFADLMQTGGNEVTRYVTRIAQKARACGIHLIIATQRPSKDTVPMIIKANVPCRIGLSCSSQIDSRVILDENGAETLLGKGDLLFKCPGKKSLIRAQSPYISNHDMNTVLDYVRSHAGDPNYDPDFLDLDVEEEVEEESNPEGDLYTDICEFVVQTGITSKTSIMRSFQVSSLKADQFIVRMQSDGILALGPNGKLILGPAAHLEDFE